MKKEEKEYTLIDKILNVVVLAMKDNGYKEEEMKQLITIEFEPNERPKYRKKIRQIIKKIYKKTFIPKF